MPLLLILLFSISLVSAKDHPTGYMGKRWAATAIFNYAPIHALSQGNYMWDPSAFTHRTKASLSYVVKPQTMVGVTYELNRTGLDRHSDESTHLVYQPTTLNLHGLGVKIKLISDGYLAPYGVFSTYHLQVLNGKLNPKVEPNQNPVIEQNEQALDLVEFSLQQATKGVEQQYFAATYGIGYQFITSYNLLLSYAMEFGFVLNTSDNNNPSISSKYSEKLTLPIFSGSIMSFNFGVGYVF